MLSDKNTLRQVEYYKFLRNVEVSVWNDVIKQVVATVEETMLKLIKETMRGD